MKKRIKSAAPVTAAKSAQRFADRVRDVRLALAKVRLELDNLVASTDLESAKEHLSAAQSKAQDVIDSVELAHGIAMGNAIEEGIAVSLATNRTLAA